MMDSYGLSTYQNSKMGLQMKSFSAKTDDLRSVQNVIIPSITTALPPFVRGV